MPLLGIPPLPQKTHITLKYCLSFHRMALIYTWFGILHKFNDIKYFDLIRFEILRYKKMNHSSQLLLFSIKYKWIDER